MTWINRNFDERKERRELLIKTAWDYFSNQFEVLKLSGGIMAPFEVFALYTVNVLELALRKDMSNQEVLDEMRKIHQFEKEMINLVDDSE